MNNLLFSTDTQFLQLSETHFFCWVLRADQENKTVHTHFSKNNIALPKSTGLSLSKHGDKDVYGLGISIDESWWLVAKNEVDGADHHAFEQTLEDSVSTYNKQHSEEKTVAMLDQSVAYKSYYLSGEKDNATEFLSHLIPYDWHGLQKHLKNHNEPKVISSVMQSVPVVVYSTLEHGYHLLIRRSFAEYAVDFMQHTANIITQG